MNTAPSRRRRSRGSLAERKPGSIRAVSLALVVTAGLVAAACSGSSDPELVAAVPSPTVTSTATPVPDPTPQPVPSPTPTPAPTAVPTPTPIEPLTRGVSDQTVGIAVVKTGLVFGDVEVGVQARLDRLNAAGGVAGRDVVLVSVFDDEGDPAVALDAAGTLVEGEDVFAIVLATASPEPALTDFLAESLMPFFGWGFAPGFCDPNEWGFGFNGCLNGSVFGVPNAEPDPTTRELTTLFFERPATAVLVTTGDAAGNAATAQAEATWRDDLLDTVLFDAQEENGSRQAAEAAVEAQADVVLLSVGLESSISLKAELGGRFDGMVLDDVGYLPGLLGDFPTAEKLEGGYSVTQFPPQEEYREVTGVLATDLQDSGGDLIYSQAVSLGYWSTDLLASVLTAVGTELNAASFYQTANVDGVQYEPDLVGAICPMDTLDIHRSPAAGGALVWVNNGIYQPVVEFTCF